MNTILFFKVRERERELKRDLLFFLSRPSGLKTTRFDGLVLGKGGSSIVFYFIFLFILPITFRSVKRHIYHSYRCLKKLMIYHSTLILFDLNLQLEIIGHDKTFYWYSYIDLNILLFRYLITKMSRYFWLSLHFFMIVDLGNYSSFSMSNDLLLLNYVLRPVHTHTFTEPALSGFSLQQVMKRLRTVYVILKHFNEQHSMN